jgi:hypothetical protein
MIEKQKPLDEDDDQDPYAALWPKLMADPEIAPPGSWSVEYHGKQKGYTIVVQQYPGFDAARAPVDYTPDIYLQNLARLFERIGNALLREEQSPGDVPPIEMLTKLLNRSRHGDVPDN